MSLSLNDLKQTFLIEAENTLAEFKDLEQRARPILIEAAELSAKVAYYRFSGNPLIVLEKSLALILRELEVAGLMVVKTAWERNIKNLFDKIVKVLITTATAAI